MTSKVLPRGRKLDKGQTNAKKSRRKFVSQQKIDFSRKGHLFWELRENAIFGIFSVPLLRKATKNRFRELSIFVSPVHFYVNSTEFEKSIERSI
jgi:hypothetical protein